MDDPFTSGSLGYKLDTSSHRRDTPSLELEEANASKEYSFSGKEETIKSKTKPVVGLSGNRRQTFEELKHVYEFVFPGIAYSRFIDSEILKDVLTYNEFVFFLKASCFALITDENYYPKKIIEYNAKENNSGTYALKEKIATIIGLPIEDKTEFSVD